MFLGGQTGTVGAAGSTPTTPPEQTTPEPTTTAPAAPESGESSFDFNSTLRQYVLDTQGIFCGNSYTANPLEGADRTCVTNVETVMTQNWNRLQDDSQRYLFLMAVMTWRGYAREDALGIFLGNLATAGSLPPEGLDPQGIVDHTHEFGNNELPMSGIFGQNFDVFPNADTDFADFVTWATNQIISGQIVRVRDIINIDAFPETPAAFLSDPVVNGADPDADARRNFAGRSIWGRAMILLTPDERQALIDDPAEQQRIMGDLLRRLAVLEAGENDAGDEMSTENLERILVRPVREEGQPVTFQLSLLPEGATIRHMSPLAEVIIRANEEGRLLDEAAAAAGIPADQLTPEIADQLWGDLLMTDEIANATAEASPTQEHPVEYGIFRLNNLHIPEGSIQMDYDDANGNGQWDPGERINGFTWTNTPGDDGHLVFRAQGGGGGLVVPLDEGRGKADLSLDAGIFYLYPGSWSGYADPSVSFAYKLAEWASFEIGAVVSFYRFYNQVRPTGDDDAFADVDGTDEGIILKELPLSFAMNFDGDEEGPSYKFDISLGYLNLRPERSIDAANLSNTPWYYATRDAYRSIGAMLDFRAAWGEGDDESWIGAQVHGASGRTLLPLDGRDATWIDGGRAGGAIGGEAVLLDNSLTLGGLLAYTRNIGGTRDGADAWTAEIGARYAINNDHSIGAMLRAEYITSSDDISSTELTFALDYNGILYRGKNWRYELGVNGSFFYRSESMAVGNLHDIGNDCAGQPEACPTVIDIELGNMAAAVFARNKFQFPYWYLSLDVGAIGTGQDGNIDLPYLMFGLSVGTSSTDQLAEENQ